MAKHLHFMAIPLYHVFGQVITTREMGPVVTSAYYLVLPEYFTAIPIVACFNYRCTV
jgi:hypothetical protein